MKRITSAALAATMSVSVLAAPAFAAEGDEKMGSSEWYQKCLKEQKEIQQEIDKARTPEEKERLEKAVDNSLRRSWHRQLHRFRCLHQGPDPRGQRVSLLRPGRPDRRAARPRCSARCGSGVLRLHPGRFPPGDPGPADVNRASK